MSTSQNYNKLIHSVRWLKLRREVLTEHPECQNCLEQGIHTFATEVHHVVPCDYGCDIRTMEQLMFSRGNLRALCHNCHVEAHKELGRSGKVAAIRIHNAKLAGIVKKFF